MRRIAYLLAVPLLLPARAALAQVGPAEPMPVAPIGAACWQPRPLPACRSFWITEFGVQWFLNQAPGVHDRRPWIATWEVGQMRNRSEVDALGGSVFLSANDQAFRSGVRARYRRWIENGEMAVDVSPALILFQADEGLEVRARLGAALQAGVTLRDWVGLTTQVEAVPGGVRLQTGFRFGSYPGAVVGVGLPLVGIAAGDDS